MGEAVEWLPDGTPRSPRFDDIYRSSTGGLEQARHVFLRGCGLPQAWAGRPQWRILETGFGLGLNFLAAWRAWKDDPAAAAHPAFRHRGSLARRRCGPGSQRRALPGARASRRGTRGAVVRPAARCASPVVRTGLRAVDALRRRRARRPAPGAVPGRFDLPGRLRPTAQRGDVGARHAQGSRAPQPPRHRDRHVDRGRRHPARARPMRLRRRKGRGAAAQAPLPERQSTRQRGSPRDCGP